MGARIGVRFVLFGNNLLMVSLFVFRYRPEWCVEHFLQGKALKKVREVREQLQDILKQQGIAVVSCGQVSQGLNNLH